MSGRIPIGLAMALVLSSMAFHPLPASAQDPDPETSDYIRVTERAWRRAVGGPLGGILPRGGQAWGIDDPALDVNVLAPDGSVVTQDHPSWFPAVDLARTVWKVAPMTPGELAMLGREIDQLPGVRAMFQPDPAQLPAGEVDYFFLYQQAKVPPERRLQDTFLVYYVGGVADGSFASAGSLARTSAPLMGTQDQSEYGYYGDRFGANKSRYDLAPRPDTEEVRGNAFRDFFATLFLDGFLYVAPAVNIGSGFRVGAVVRDGDTFYLDELAGTQGLGSLVRVDPSMATSVEWASVFATWSGDGGVAYLDVKPAGPGAVTATLTQEARGEGDLGEFQPLRVEQREDGSWRHWFTNLAEGRYRVNATWQGSTASPEQFGLDLQHALGGSAFSIGDIGASGFVLGDPNRGAATRPPRADEVPRGFGDPFLFPDPSLTEVGDLVRNGVFACPEPIGSAQFAAVGLTAGITVVEVEDGERCVEIVPLEWSVSDPTVGTITPGGVFTALAAGQAELIAAIKAGRDRRRVTRGVTVVAATDDQGMRFEDGEGKPTAVATAIHAVSEALSEEIDYLRERSAEAVAESDTSWADRLADSFDALFSPDLRVRVRVLLPDGQVPGSALRVRSLLPDGRGLDSLTIERYNGPDESGAVWTDDIVLVQRGAVEAGLQDTVVPGSRVLFLGGVPGGRLVATIEGVGEVTAEVQGHLGPPVGIAMYAYDDDD